MRMIARGGAIAAMGYLPVEPAAEDKTGDVEILALANHDCQPIDSPHRHEGGYVLAQLHLTPNLLFAQRKSRTFDQAMKHAIGLMAQISTRAAMPKKILVVDNELRSRQLIAYLLREESYEVDEADDGVSALAILEKKNFDLMICDVVMPRLNAFDVIDYMKSRSLSTSIILITGHPYLLAEKGLGSLPCFMKPFNMYDLLHKVKEMLSK